MRLTARRVGGGAIVAVADNGDAVLDPGSLFTRRSESAVGSGIGLATAQRLAVAEGRRLQVGHAGPGAELQLMFGGPVPSGGP